ncbi:hypothetical protein GUITHDRAFT_140588 [Guillardia theta CCMP2712]|uniref:RWP-RK domain-containing protein n=1 Tax=Guillardia theta (strain CCMP2712) TaxID=905079 RepID=L1J5A2_GUITC|nr:hypothetical protein GUITHDRAFT_140588 [Guillardia theta CCMP2712]EKX43269.1 hypothetical protein GUITHDRAFT_140588 [Guillardia theta CCMP2712]|eukprot:XP_005830249.1 hypothetical protein GUITHDRAFT_140588 [Guillardia theta CCMP2712]
MSFMSDQFAAKRNLVRDQVVIYPRRKSGQANRDLGIVVLNRDMIDSLCWLPLPSAAEILKISPTALKTACRSLGIIRWPYSRAETRCVPSPAAASIPAVPVAAQRKEVPSKPVKVEVASPPEQPSVSAIIKSVKEEQQLLASESSETEGTTNDECDSLQTSDDEISHLLTGHEDDLAWLAAGLVPNPELEFHAPLPCSA